MHQTGVSAIFHLSHTHTHTHPLLQAASQPAPGGVVRCSDRAGGGRTSLIVASFHKTLPDLTQSDATLSAWHGLVHLPSLQSFPEPTKFSRPSRKKVCCENVRDNDPVKAFNHGQTKWIVKFCPSDQEHIRLVRAAIPQTIA